MKKHFFFIKAFLKKGHQKGTKNFTPPPYSISFLSVLHQNKALYNFCKRWQYSIVKHNTSLEYALQATESNQYFRYIINVLQAKGYQFHEIDSNKDNDDEDLNEIDIFS